MDSCIVIPAFNEEGLPILLKKLQKHKVAVVVVDDGSFKMDAPDGISVIRHEKNMGKGAAIRTGILYAKQKGYKNVLLMDADCQHDPIDALNILKSPFHTVFGVRCFNRKMPFMRKIANIASSILCSVIIRKRIPDIHCGLRKINIDDLDGIIINGNRFDGELELALKLLKRSKITHFPINTIYTDKKSSIDPLLDTIRFFRTVFIYGL